MSKRVLRRPAGETTNTYWKKRAFRRLGGFICQCCEEWRKPFLTIDHIEGKGIAHRKQFKGGHTAFYKWIATTTENLAEVLQILCMNCNWSKRYGECPHQKSTKREIAREEVELLRQEIDELERERIRLQGQILKLRVVMEPVSESIPLGYELVRHIAPLDPKEFVSSVPSENQGDRAISLESSAVSIR